MDRQVVWRIWMIFEDGTFWASYPMDRYFAKNELAIIASGEPWHEQPNKRVVRAKIV